MLHRMEGVGLPNVFLKSGYVIEGAGDTETVAYPALDELYRSIAGSVARRAAPLTGLEFRFLRKRLSLSQEQAGAIVGKTLQAVAKWEKGTASVPTADGKVMRLAWLARFSRRDLGRVVDMMVRASDFVPAGYVFAFNGETWLDQSQELIAETVQRARAEAAAAIGRAKLVTSSYTSGAASAMLPPMLRAQKEITT